MKILDAFADSAYELLRVVAGLMFSFHGAQKVLGLLSESQPPIGSQLWIGGVIELVGGILIMIGFKTRAAAFICSGMMAVAYIQFHWQFQTGSSFLPGINKGELAVLYCFVFLYIACRGSLKWSVERGR